jgi:hypothetical protein
MEKNSILNIKQSENKNNFLQMLIFKYKNHPKSHNKSNKQNTHNNKILLSIIDYMEFKDILNFKLLCKTISYEMNETLIKNYLKNVGMYSDDIRKSYLILWTKFTNYSR